MVAGLDRGARRETEHQVATSSLHPRTASGLVFVEWHEALSDIGV